MNQEEIIEYLKRTNELEERLTGQDKETLQWLIYGYNECANLLYQNEDKIKKTVDYINYYLLGNRKFEESQKQFKRLLKMLGGKD